MARANLNLSSEIINSFIQAQDNINIRLLKISINNENLILETTVSLQSSLSNDFNQLIPTIVSLNEACFIIFRLYDNTNEYNNKWSTNTWLLITWIPDNCRVRDKMLYSSSKEDLKHGLGLGYFESEYSISQYEDINWNLLSNYLSKDDKVLLSDKEIMIKEEKILSNNESHKTKSSAMGLLPMDISPDNISSLTEFVNNIYNWIEIRVINESIHITSKLFIIKDQKISDLLNNEEPRFYLTRLAKKSTSELINIFIYSCPENSTIKLKMTSSSAKATVLYILKQNDISVDKTLEIRDSDEINDLISQEIDYAHTGATPTSATTTTNFTHSKPTRPGKGKARVSKFQDEL